MDLANQIILIAGLLFLVSILASLISSRIGAPLLLIFLVIGMLMGESGPGGIVFDDFSVAYLVGSLALAVILFDGGLRTKVETFRVGLRPAVTLATVGVVLTVGITGLLASWLLELPLIVGLLIASIVGSTDAAAVFYLLRAHGLELKQRVGATLEIESGSNDPMAIFLTIALVEFLVGEHQSLGGGLLLEFVQQMGIGAVVGLAGGLLMQRLINRVRLTPGLYPLLAVSGALFLFGAASVINGSGFLAVYLAGILLGNRPLQSAQNIRRFHDGLAWLAQIIMFLMLGLLVTPRELLDVAVPALVVAAILILLARPLAVVACLQPFRFPWREQLFMGWVGLRGAVPILLGLLPFLAGAEGAGMYFNIAFFVVLISLVIQGWTVAPLARLLGLDVPPRSRVVDRMELDLPGQAEFELVGYTIEDDSPAVYKMVGRIKLPDNTRIVTVVRQGNPLADAADDILQVNDYVYVLTSPDQLPALDRVFVAEHGPTRLEEHVFFGDFVLNGDIDLDDLAGAYGLDIPDRKAADRDLNGYLLRIFKKRAVVGDRVRLNNMEFVVREMDNGQISKVGLKIRRKTGGKR